MERTTPYSAFRFKFIDISKNKMVAAFSDIQGLNSNIKVAEYRNGDDKENHVTKIPTGHDFENITLKRGIVDSTAFWKWMSDTYTMGPQAKRDIQIVLQSESGKDVQSWKLVGAFPIKYTGPTLQANPGTEVAMEEWQLAYDTMQFAQEGTPA